MKSLWLEGGNFDVSRDKKYLKKKEKKKERLTGTFMSSPIVDTISGQVNQLIRTSTYIHFNNSIDTSRISYIIDIVFMFGILCVTLGFHVQNFFRFFLWDRLVHMY